MRKIIDFFIYILFKIKDNQRAVILMLLVPFSEAKAIFYNVDKKVSWYLFSEHKRQLCMVVEDYSNIIIFGVVFYFLTKEDKTKLEIEVARFLCCLNALDLIHLGLMDMQGFVMVKFILAYLIYMLWSRLKRFY